MVSRNTVGIRERAMKLLATLFLAVLMTHTAFAADDEFPVYTPHATVRGPRADKDFPIVDTPAYKGVTVPAFCASLRLIP